MFQIWLGLSKAHLGNIWTSYSPISSLLNSSLNLIINKIRDINTMIKVLEFSQESLDTNYSISE